MTKERDLLPWIFGGLSAATVALAVAAVATHRTSPAPTPRVAVMPSSTPSSNTTPAPIAAPVSAPETAPAAVANSAIAPPAGESEAQPGQIWECTTKGVKTFSNNPCGKDSSLLEVGPINSMHATPPPRLAYAYPAQPRYAQPSYVDAGAPSNDDEDYADQSGTESGGDSYTIVQGVAFLPRRHPGHHPPHQPPHQHHSVSAPRKF
jgi:hypothetical protein